MGTMTESQWLNRGDSAAREDLRVCERDALKGNSYNIRGIWDRDAVLAELGILNETDTDASAYGLSGDDLAAAQRAALAGYARVMEQ